MWGEVTDPFTLRWAEFRNLPTAEQAAALEPNNPEGYHRVAVFYWDKTRGDFRKCLKCQNEWAAPEVEEVVVDEEVVAV